MRVQSWERVLGTHASLLSPAPPSRAELQLHLPANQLQAVEGGEVVLPAWYTLHAEVSSSPARGGALCDVVLQR